MQKIIIDKPYSVKIEEVDIPKPGPGELLVKTELSGISSGTEMMLYRGTFPNFKLKKWAQWQDYPVCPGYELVGTVVEIGKDASSQGKDLKQMDSLGPKSNVMITTTADFKVGDRVICFGEHGEYAISPAVLSAKVPENIPSEEATLGVLTTTAMHCVRRSEIAYGDIVAIIGVGVLGFLTIQHMKNAGARHIIALDLDDSRLEIAKKCGADLVINPGKANPKQAIMDAFGILPDIVIEASGFKGTEQLAMEIARDRGRIVILGWHTDDINFMFGDFYFKELDLRATRAVGPEAGLPYAYVRYGSDQSLIWSMELMGKGLISGKFFKPTRFNYKDIAKAYDLIDKRDKSIGLQVILDW